MIRSIAAVVLGYVAMVVWVMLTASLAWTALGAGFAFAEGTTETTMGWILVMVVLGFVGALIGGFVCARLSISPVAVKVLAVLILVFGVGLALMNLAIDSTAEIEEAIANLDKPFSELGPLEAGTVAIQPDWYNFVIPIVGAIGVVLGGRRRP